MTQIVNIFVRILAMFLIVMVLHGTALGDLAPLPPQIPGTQTDLPEPLSIAVAGSLLAVAVGLAGVLAGRSGNSGRKKTAIGFALVIVLATIGTAVFTQREYAEVLREHIEMKNEQMNRHYGEELEAQRERPRKAAEQSSDDHEASDDAPTPSLEHPPTDS